MRLGTRGSRLALAQVEIVRALYREAYPGEDLEPVVIRTSGDRGDRDRLGAFVREIQEALLRGEVDAALHCLKDLPTAPVPGLSFGAYLERGDPRDAILTRGPALDELPPAPVIGTGSVRRTSQVARLRPDAVFRPLVGNVDTRMRRLLEGEYDAIVLAVAGLERLGAFDLGGIVVRPASVEEIVPAAGQAVLVLETRTGEEARVSALDHPPTAAASRAERAFLAAFGGGCSVPVGAYARGGELTGYVGSPDGRGRSLGRFQGDDPERLGRVLAEEMIASGTPNFRGSAA